MKGIEFRDEPFLCDGCSSSPPTTRYDVPAGTPIVTTKDARTGEVTQIRSAGSWGLCDACRAELDRATSTTDAARALAARMLVHSEALRAIPAGARRVASVALVRLNERLLPLLKNPRPVVRGEDSLDGKSAWFDGAPPAPAPSAN